MPESKDAHTIKTEWLESQIAKNEGVDRILEGIALVRQGGEEGIQEIALEHPGTIINVLEVMVALIIQQRDDITDLGEKWLSSIENVESLRQDYDNLVTKYVL